jgi:hypothetical protein
VTDHPKNKNKKTILFNLSAVMIALLLGCASNKDLGVFPPESKRITDIVITENSESLFLTIKGNQPLTYTVIKQASPNGVLFQFPATALGIGKGIYSLPEYEIISFIKASENVADNTTTSLIFVALTRDTPYNLTPDKDGLKVSFSKATKISKGAEPPKQASAKKPEPKAIQKKVPEPEETQKKVPEPGAIQKTMPSATLLTAVTVKSGNDSIVVNVDADGLIKEYQSFTMNQPARIVLDIPNVKSQFDTEKRIAVDSKWVKRIRYFGHPGKLRLVLETHSDYLSKYRIDPTETGLLIQVGKTLVVPVKASQTTKDENSGTRQVRITWDKVPNAISYNVYLSNSPGVTRRSGNKISNVKNNYTVAELKRGATYYFVVTAVNESGESNESEEMSFTVGD